MQLLEIYDPLLPMGEICPAEVVVKAVMHEDLQLWPSVAKATRVRTPRGPRPDAKRYREPC